MPQHEETMSRLEQAAPIGVARIDGAFRLVATRPVSAGEFLLALEGQLVERPTRYSIQVGANLHIDPWVDPAREDAFDRHLCRFLNHSCAPTAQIRGRQVFALRALAPWEEITFDYLTTEEEMAVPFRCRCGACDGIWIRGFRHLDAAERERRRPFLAEHLRQ